MNVLVCTDVSLPQPISLLSETVVHQLSFSLQVCRWGKKTVAWQISVVPEFLLKHRQLVHSFFPSLSSSITPSFFPLALMNSAQQKCPVEEVCLWQWHDIFLIVLCLLILIGCRDGGDVIVAHLLSLFLTSCNHSYKSDMPLRAWASLSSFILGDKMHLSLV